MEFQERKIFGSKFPICDMVFRSFDVRINENERKGLLEKPVFLYAFIYICQLTHYPNELMSGYESGGIFFIRNLRYTYKQVLFFCFFRYCFFPVINARMFTGSPFLPGQRQPAGS